MATTGPDGLRLAGRKLPGWRGIRTEDVAALWQAEQTIRQNRSAFEAKWKQKEDEFNREWSGRSPRPTIDDIDGLGAFDPEIFKALKDAQVGRPGSSDSSAQRIRELLNKQAPTYRPRLPGVMPRRGTRDEAFAALQKEYDREARKVVGISGSGFSLDPSVDYAGLAAEVEKMQAVLTSLGGPPPT